MHETDGDNLFPSVDKENADHSARLVLETILRKPTTFPSGNRAISTLRRSTLPLILSKKNVLTSDKFKMAEGAAEKNISSEFNGETVV